MSLYTLTQGNSPQARPSGPIQPLSAQDRNNIQVISAGGIAPPGTPVSVAEKQAFVLTVTGSGAVSATAQIMGSNDQNFPTNGNWVPIGDPITASGTNKASVSVSGTAPFAYFGAQITAISGTQANAVVTMSA